MKEANKVSCLKLIWRLVSNQPTLWVLWMKRTLLHYSFWKIKGNTTKGSWMWIKILKHREIAKEFHKVEIGNGAVTSFWFDSWSRLGRLHDITWDIGFIDLGISANSTVESVMSDHRRRQHRTEILNSIEAEIAKVMSNRSTKEGLSLWRVSEDKYKKLHHSRN